MITKGRSITRVPDADLFLLYIKTQNYSDETVYNYEEDLKHLDNFLEIEQLTFNGLTKAQMNQFKVYLVSRDRKEPFTGLTAAAKLGARSVNRVLSSLRTYFRYLIDMDKSVPIPPDAIKLIKTDKKHGQVAELSELITLIESPVKCWKCYWHLACGFRNWLV